MAQNEPLLASRRHRDHEFERPLGAPASLPANAPPAKMPALPGKNRGDVRIAGSGHASLNGFLAAFVLVLWISIGFCPAQSLPNTLTLEQNPNGLRLQYAVRETNGMFFLLQGGQVHNLRSAGQILLSGSAASRPSGVLDLPWPAGATNTFFGLFQEPANLPSGPPFAAPTRMAWIPPGTFSMGSPITEKGRDSDEGPEIAVTLTKGFFMGQFEVTQAEYLAIMTNNPSWFTKTNGYPEDLSRPVEVVSWDDATDYCARLSALERSLGRLPAGWIYRLPTEAEWEYACRGGTVTVFGVGNDLRSGMANFDGRMEYLANVGPATNQAGVFLGRTSPVGGFQPNAWGLYDMHGNVYEWCWDWYEIYPGGTAIDPRGPAAGSFRVFRGGCWETAARLCRSALRNFSWQTVLSADIGFRVVLAQEWPAP